MTVTPAGAPGALSTMNVSDASDPALVPTELVAVTTQLYVSPPTSEVTVIGELARLAVLSPWLDVHVTVYDVIALPPSLAGGSNETENSSSLRSTDVMAGAPGASTIATGVFGFAADAGLSPTGLVATTTHW